MNLLRPCLTITGILLALSTGAYPAVVTVLGQAMFPHAAMGSLIEKEGKVVGSSLIGQTLANPSGQPDYFWGRPTGASADKDTGVLVSGGSNYGPLNASLTEEVDGRVKALRDTGVAGDIPADLVTKSASGLDPHLSPEAVALQIPRVAKARGLSEGVVRQLVDEHTEGRSLGLGEPRVNVLELNLALDERVAPRPPPAPSPSAAPASP